MMYKSTNFILYDYEADETTITVSADGDGFGMVQVDANKEYFGQMHFSIDAKSALLLGQAIIDQANLLLIEK